MFDKIHQIHMLYVLDANSYSSVYSSN